MPPQPGLSAHRSPKIETKSFDRPNQKITNRRASAIGYFTVFLTSAVTLVAMELKAKNLECHRGGRMVFAGLSFELQPGQGMLLKGPNGIGKTSLLRILAGLGELASGSLETSETDDEFTLPQLTHYVSHQNALKPALSVEENLAFWARFMGKDCSFSEIHDRLAGFELERLASYSAALLSAGQKRRLALARLELVHRPLWLLDEPSVGLDVASCKLLADAMERHLSTEGILIASTHTDLGVRFTRELDMSDYSGKTE